MSCDNCGVEAGVGGEESKAHCWMGSDEWLQEHEPERYIELMADAYAADEYPEELSATCLLPDGHDGPHEFTPDKDIEIRFSEPEP